MVSAKLTNDHSAVCVVKATRSYVEFEIFYLDEQGILQRRRTTAKTLRGAVTQAKITPSTIVDASVKTDGVWVEVKLDALDALMGV